MVTYGMVCVAGVCGASGSMDDARVNLFARYESRLTAPGPSFLPVTLITGYLGSGKTTLVTHILQHKQQVGRGGSTGLCTPLVSTPTRCYWHNNGATSPAVARS